MHSCSYNRCTLHRWWWWVLQRLLKRMGTSTRRRKFWDRFVGQRVNYTWLVKGAVLRLLRMLAFDRCKWCKQGHVYMSPCEKPTRAAKPSSRFFIFDGTFGRFLTNFDPVSSPVQPQYNSKQNLLSLRAARRWPVVYAGPYDKTSPLAVSILFNENVLILFNFIIWIYINIWMQF